MINLVLIPSFPRPQLSLRMYRHCKAISECTKGLILTDQRIKAPTITVVVNNHEVTKTSVETSKASPPKSIYAELAPGLVHPTSGQHTHTHTHTHTHQSRSHPYGNKIPDIFIAACASSRNAPLTLRLLYSWTDLAAWLSIQARCCKRRSIFGTDLGS